MEHFGVKDQLCYIPSLLIVFATQWRDIGDVVGMGVSDADCVNAENAVWYCYTLDLILGGGGWSGPAGNLCHGPDVESLYATVGHHPVPRHLLRSLWRLVLTARPISQSQNYRVKVKTIRNLVLIGAEFAVIIKINAWLFTYRSKMLKNIILTTTGAQF